MDWLCDPDAPRFRQIARYADLAAHERYLARLLAAYRGPLYGEWSAELRRTRERLAELERRFAVMC